MRRENGGTSTGRLGVMCPGCLRSSQEVAICVGRHEEKLPRAHAGAARVKERRSRCQEVSAKSWVENEDHSDKRPAYWRSKMHFGDRSVTGVTRSGES